MSSSTDTAGPHRVAVAYVIRAHGIRGDLLIKPLTERTGRFVAGARFYLGDSDVQITVREVRRHNEGLILSVEGLDDRTSAERHAKSTLGIDPADRRTLDADEYWPEDLVGLRAVSPDGDVLGIVTDVVLGAAQDRLVVTTAAGLAVDVPFVTALVGEPSRGEIPIDPPTGLFDQGASPDVAHDAETGPGSRAHEDLDGAGGA